MDIGALDVDITSTSSAVKDFFKLLPNPVVIESNFISKAIVSCSVYMCASVCVSAPLCVCTRVHLCMFRSCVYW